MLASQEIAEAQAAREEREQIELESEHDVRYRLSLYGFGSSRNDDALLVARMRGRATLENNDIIATITYADGVYDVSSAARGA